MTRFHLAQVNIGRFVAPIDDPVMEGFRAQLRLQCQEPFIRGKDLERSFEGYSICFDCFVSGFTGGKAWRRFYHRIGGVAARMNGDIIRVWWAAYLEESLLWLVALEDGTTTMLHPKEFDSMVAS